MKILIVNSGLRHGGAETQIIYLCHAFVRMGHQVALYLLTPETDRVSDLPPEVHVEQGHKSSPFDIREVMRLRRFIQKWRPDVVKGFLFDANFYTRLAGVGTGIPIINGERNDGYELNRNQALAHYPTRVLANAVVANTHAGRAFAQRLFGIHESRTHVVWNGIDVAKVQNFSPNADEKQTLRRDLFGEGDFKVVVVVGTIRRSKDHMLALKVCAALQRSDVSWRFMFVGDAPTGFGHYRSKAASEEAQYKQEVFDFVKSQGLTASVVFTGKRDDAIKLIAAADVLLSTSVHEGFPNVVLEAMAAGTPVVSTAYSDITHILPFKWQVSPERDAQSLAQRVQNAWANHDAISAEQRAFVEREATVDISAQRMLAVFQQYAAKKVPPK
ncbi:glycosyltransferase [Aquabacterium sp. A3]|uniref:glycosyltransferase n=1 Tax=Aquabacterium sp. A3 TaxID=3132829 RepID=UPI00311A01DA